MTEDERRSRGAHAAPGMSDDVRKLIDGVQDWVRGVLPSPEHLHTGPDCQWCPLCQFAEVVRGDHPEVAEKITEAGAAFVNAVRAVFDAAGKPPSTSRAPAPAQRPRPRPYPSKPRVEHIRLDESE